MTLLEKLRPIYQDKLASANLQYPDTVANVVEHLDSYDEVSDLPYGIFAELKLMTGTYCTSAYEFFNL
jgi:hypothetical protein